MSSFLDLSGQRLGAIPSAVFSQVELETLWVDNNDLNAIPEEIRLLANLKRLSAYKNCLQKPLNALA